jgi:hypothetical protein
MPSNTRDCSHGDAGRRPRWRRPGVRPEKFAAVSGSRRRGKRGNLVISGKEALNLPRRLEPLHDPLSSSGRLMGVFGPVIDALVLAMLDPGMISRLAAALASRSLQPHRVRRFKRSPRCSEFGVAGVTLPGFGEFGVVAGFGS